MSDRVSVFTYGTLQIPAVIHAVTGTSFEAAPAWLDNYQRYRVKNQSFPGIISYNNASVDGVLYRDIDNRSLARLDKFEDFLYARLLVDVIVNGTTEQAFAYIVKDEYRQYLSDEAWSLAEFEQKLLPRYINRIGQAVRRSGKASPVRGKK